MLIDGDLGVNGNIYSLNPGGSVAVNAGNNGLTIDGSSNEVDVISDSDSSDANARGKLLMTPTTAKLLVNTDSGASHGLDISQSRTILSGGTASTSLTLNDDGATFLNTTNNQPARVMGVADGEGPYDAVNYRQLQEHSKRAYSGIASVAAMASIPDPLGGKNFAIGAGFGNYAGENAVAMGFKAVVSKKKDIVVSGSVGYSDNNPVTGAGVSYSW
jgi:hypothetical protein